jgi:hypothetical protein
MFVTATSLVVNSKKLNCTFPTTCTLVRAFAVMFDDCEAACFIAITDTLLTMHTSVVFTKPIAIKISERF